MLFDRYPLKQRQEVGAPRAADCGKSKKRGSIESISGTRIEKADLARFLSAERIVQPAVTLQSSYNRIFWLFVLKAIFHQRN